MLAGVFWSTAAGLIGGYVLLFALARRPVTLRPARVGALLAVIVVLRLILIAAGVPLQGPSRLMGIIFVGVVAVALLLARRIWLVRLTTVELREQIQTACRGLFLIVNEQTTGKLQLAVTDELTLHIMTLTSRVQVLVLYRVPDAGKAALLYHWLAKQYPAPVPRVRIVLKGAES